MALGHRHEDEREPVPRSASEESVVREPFGIAQAAALALGVFLVVVGAIALARTGFDGFTTARTEVGGMSQTPLLALIHLALGLVSLAGAAGREASRSAAMFVGPVLIAMGIIALIEPIAGLGWNDTSGIVYIIAGGIMLTASALTPLTYRSRHTSF